MKILNKRMLIVVGIFVICCLFAGMVIAQYPAHFFGTVRVESGHVVVDQGYYGFLDSMSGTYGLRPRTDANVLELRTDALPRIQIPSTGETRVLYGLVPANKSSDPCGTSFPESAIFYNAADHTWCGCDNTGAVKLSDGSACFE